MQHVIVSNIGDLAGGGGGAVPPKYELKHHHWIDNTSLSDRAGYTHKKVFLVPFILLSVWHYSDNGMGAVSLQTDLAVNTSAPADQLILQKLKHFISYNQSLGNPSIVNQALAGLALPAMELPPLTLHVNTGGWKGGIIYLEKLNYVAP